MLRDLLLHTTGVGTEGKVVEYRQFLNEQRLGTKKLDKAKEWVELSAAAVKYIFVAKKFSFNGLFFFEIIRIIQVFLRGLGKLAFDPSYGWL